MQHALGHRGKVAGIGDGQKVFAGFAAGDIRPPDDLFRLPLMQVEQRAARGYRRPQRGCLLCLACLVPGAFQQRVGGVALALMDGQEASDRIDVRIDIRGRQCGRVQFGLPNIGARNEGLDGRERVAFLQVHVLGNGSCEQLETGGV